MEDDVIEKLRLQHMDNYRNAILENIKNNTNVLVDEDIMSLTRKPPLDSMDLIKSKFLDLAKKNKIILDTKELDKLLDDYRKYNKKCFDKIKDIRLTELSNKVIKIKFEKSNDVIKINKKDFTNINKQIKNLIKEQLRESFEKKISKNIDKIFVGDISCDVKKRIIDDITRYVNGSYQKQLLESVDIKILVKDTTLINGTKEQSERYLFTLNNSRLLKDDLGE